MLWDGEKGVPKKVKKKKAAISLLFSFGGRLTGLEPATPSATS